MTEYVIFFGQDNKDVVEPTSLPETFQVFLNVGASLIFMIRYTHSSVQQSDPHPYREGAQVYA